MKTAHRIEIVALTTAEAWSQLGILDRFLTEGRRYVSWENHDTCATRMLTVLAAVEAEQPAGRITVGPVTAPSCMTRMKEAQFAASRAS
ncbi:zeta toxin family protein [Streptomyces cinereoruber]|uniref:zeta toxin family protein n=1 Tax=Streptomyces cinereoruber TaxID=67260 RepID=UPI0036436B9F